MKQLYLIIFFLLFNSNIFAQTQINRSEVYYGWNPPGNSVATLTIIGLENNTTYSVYNLENSQLLGFGTINQYNISIISLGSGNTGIKYFKVVTNQPALIYFGYDCCSVGSTTYYPTIDGHSYIGKRFIVWIPVLTDANRFNITAFEQSTVTISSPLSPSSSLFNINQGEVRNLNSALTAQTIYIVESTGDIMLSSNSHNGYSSAPPGYTPFSPGISTERCDNDAGTYFIVGTRTWNEGTGAIALFTYRDTEITLTRISDGSVYGPYDISTSTYFRSGFGDDFFIISSTNNISIWNGSTEGGNTISFMGDDIAFNVGTESGKSFIINTQNHGALIFASENNTEIYINDSYETSLNADQYYLLATNLNININATSPIFIETSGGNDLNDWGGFLRPALRLDRDGDTINDFDEGGACGLVSPDTDGDSIIDSLDTDSDNDNVPDNIEAGDSETDTDPSDTDGDQTPDFRDTDSDDDDIEDGIDNCRLIQNYDQENHDDDDLGDICDDDDDNDNDPDITDCNSFDNSMFHGNIEICDGKDNDCNNIIDDNFTDNDSDNIADCIDPDDDNDDINDEQDNCPQDYNPYQEDLDYDGIGDACDDDNDSDDDGINDEQDNCPESYNPDQNDIDNDLIGDLCDPDIDGDGVINNIDCNPQDPEIFPGNIEICDGKDNNCDDNIDENACYIDGGFEDAENDVEIEDVYAQHDIWEDIENDSSIAQDDTVDDISVDEENNNLNKSSGCGCKIVSSHKSSLSILSILLTGFIIFISNKF